MSPSGERRVSALWIGGQGPDAARRQQPVVRPVKEIALGSSDSHERGRLETGVVLRVDVPVDEAPAEVVHPGRGRSMAAEDARDDRRHTLRDLPVRTPTHVRVAGDGTHRWPASARRTPW